MNSRDAQKVLAASVDLLNNLSTETHLTTALARYSPDDLEAKTIHSIKGTQVFNFTLEVGCVIPLHASAPGKAMLSKMTHSELEQQFAVMKLERYTDTTIVETPGLAQEIAGDIKRGFSVDLGENLIGVNCVSCAFRHPKTQSLYAVWVTGLSINIPQSEFASLAMKVQSCIHQIVKRLEDSELNQGDFAAIIVQRAKDNLQADLNKNIQMKSFAEDVLGVGYSWFRKKFKLMTGTSPNQYLLDLKMEKARTLLEQTELSVKEISHSLGYDSQDYFSAQFKKKHHVSPSGFRESLAVK
ncbi:IclR family transcriptional regulator domain-containing protein [Persicirhabdus sediminis]|uniref:Helix-turn-helix domain-containing protein n=1 Tax=Persicirhabdus sediminis TaxID=454144 RepID=A0A8J7MEG8_9BACT|nr:helix-turn-helix domain-containing protein [Persicirhabdus sediminis]MBK1791213.1 helix-turn-helix domain-containing protein [Persicirhabdus sediminis]